MAGFTVENNLNASNVNKGTTCKKGVSKQYRRICQDARSYIESLTTQERGRLREAPQSAAGNHMHNCLDEQFLTRQALDENRKGFMEVIDRLQDCMKSLALNGDSNDNNGETQLDEDLITLKQFLEVQKIENKSTLQQIHKIEEAVAESNSDQIVVTTLANSFHVKRAVSKNNSMQLVGSMMEETLRDIGKIRYNTRFGVLEGDSRF